MSNDIFKAAAHYAATFSWPIVKVYGMRGERCACGKGHGCGTPGKHPVEAEWLSHATSDEEAIASWFEDGSEWNIGLPLGPASGLADTEWDNEQALATAKRFGLVNAKTPGYSSSRGAHRLWILDQRLLAIQKAKVDLDGLEIRFGGGGKQTQSIIPPSRHHTGKRYEWEPGRSPDEVDPMPMPEALVLAILAAAGDVSGKEGLITKDTLYQRVLQKGERNTGLLKWISSEIMRMRDPHDPAEQQNVLLVLRSLNQTRCAEPLDDRELRQIWMGQLRWGMKARAAGATKVASTDTDADKKVEEARAANVHAASGLEFRSGEWWPGMWRLTVVHSDPKEFRLHVPVVANSDGNGDCIFVSLSSADWASPMAVARRILESTGTIDVQDPNPKEWAKIWNGYSFKKEGEKQTTRVRGLKVKLMDDRAEEWPPAEQQRFAQVAGWLLDALTNVAPPDGDLDDSQPNPTGKPAWVRNDADGFDLYFSWNRVFEDIEKTRKQKLREGEGTALKRRILAAAGEAEFKVERVRTGSGVRRRYYVWSQKHIDHLANIAHPDGEAGQNSLLDKGQIDFQKPISAAGSLVSGPA
jgi:hypothetical protein